MLKLSLVVPCYNEDSNIIPFTDAVLSAFQGCGYEYEIIFVNDGSTDDSWEKLTQVYQNQKCLISALSFSRNFGKEAAVYAGISEACGEYVAIIDADLQQNPELVREMVRILDEKDEYDVVAAYQAHRNEGAVLRFCKKSFYGMINKLSSVPLHPDASDFRTFRRNTVGKQLLSLREVHRFSKGLFSWVGYQTCYIPYEASERYAGTTKWSFHKLVNYAIEEIVSFSTAPLRFASYLGAMTATADFIYLCVLLIRKIGWHIPFFPGSIPLFFLFLLTSIQLFCMGLMGEYIGRTYDQSKDRPVYIAKQCLRWGDRKSDYAEIDPAK